MFQRCGVAQVQERFAGGGDALQYAGPIDALRKILRYEGPRALYQGVVPGVVGSGMAWGMYMLAYNNAKARWASAVTYGADAWRGA